MIILLSPAKTFSKNLIPSDQEPPFKNEAKALMRALKHVPLLTLQKRMKLSDPLLEEVKGYIDHFGKNHFQAITTYEGQAFKALNVRSMDMDTLRYMKDHLLILSGLYGLIRPHDGISLYRLEMQDKTIKNLYSFWKPKIKTYLTTYHKDELIINLASKEYAMVLDDSIDYVTIHFYEKKNHTLAQHSMMIKTMRGKFSRHLLLHKIEDLEAITSVKIDDYIYDPKLSDSKNLFFVKEVSL